MNTKLYPKCKLLCTLALLPAFAALGVDAFAQTPNPLLRPAQRGVALPQGGERAEGPGGSARIPQARPIPESVDGRGSPMPGNIGATNGSTGGLTPGSSPEIALRDELASYAATAIVDDVAILRLTSVGGQHGQGNDASQRQQGIRLAMHRVKSGQPLLVAGVTVKPVVHSTHVDFTLNGGSVIVATVALESTTNKHAPDTRELIDQGFASRISPARSQNTLGGTSTAPGTPSVNGVAAPPR